MRLPVSLALPGRPLEGAGNGASRGMAAAPHRGDRTRLTERSAFCAQPPIRSARRAAVHWKPSQNAIILALRNPNPNESPDMPENEMDRLWAPWRIDYVSIADKDEGCFLCAAASSEADREHLVVMREQQCMCVINRWPYNNGHLMVAPLAHKANLSDFSDEEMLAMVRMLQRCKEMLAEVMQPAGFNIGANLGAAAGAGVATHLHWHIVPRWVGDTNFMSVVADTRVIPQSLDSLWEMLRSLAQDEQG